MNKFKSFTIEYLPIRENKDKSITPPRCKISNCFDKQTVILTISKNDNNILDTAKKYLEDKTEICGYSETAKGFQIYTNWNFKLK